MPKQSRDSAHLFITQALTNEDVNLSVYKDEAFKNSLRLVAIDSILSILHKIHSKHLHAQQRSPRPGQQNPEPFNIQEYINQVHPITGLNMLDYCLAAGLDEMAITLVHHGAVSKNLQSFRQNVNSSFPNGIIQPDIVKDIRTIINGCMEIKQNYDQFVKKTNAVLPRMVSAGQRIYRGYSTPTLILVGIGGVLLAPFLQPLIHGVGATAMFVSAGFLPAVISGVYSATRADRPQQLQLTDVQDEQQDDLETLKYLINMAKSIKVELADKPAQLQQHYSRHKKHVLHHPPHAPQAPLLFQLAKNEKLQKKRASNPAEFTPHKPMKKQVA
jgi:hypothetical protein